MRGEIRVAPRKVNVYFFEHPLEAYQMPGRYAYQASAKAIDLDGGMLRPWTGTIYADGFGADTPGSNIDPNVFSEVLPWHLSFCRLTDSRHPDMSDSGRQPDSSHAQGSEINLVRVFRSEINLVRVFQVRVFQGLSAASRGGNRSRLFAEHPDWVVQCVDGDVPLVHARCYGEFRWHKRSEEYYVLDVTHPDAEAYLRGVFRTWRHDWGARYFKPTSCSPAWNMAPTVSRCDRI